MIRKKKNPEPLITLKVTGEPYKAKIRGAGEDRLLLPMSDGKSYTVTELVAMMPKDQASGLPVLTKSCIGSRLRNPLIGPFSPSLFWPPAEPGQRVDGKHANSKNGHKKVKNGNGFAGDVDLGGGVRSHNLKRIPGPGIWEKNNG